MCGFTYHDAWRLPAWEVGGEVPWRRPPQSCWSSSVFWHRGLLPGAGCPCKQPVVHQGLLLSHTVLETLAPPLGLVLPVSLLWTPQILGPEYRPLHLKNKGKLFLFTAISIFSPLYCSLALVSLMTFLLLPREMLSSRKHLISLGMEYLCLISHHDPWQCCRIWCATHACLWTSLLLLSTP